MMKEKNTFVGRICELSDRNKTHSDIEVFYYFSEKLPLFRNLYYFREPFLTMFYTINSSPMLVSQFLS